MASKRAGQHKVMRRHFLESLGIRDGHGWSCFYCHQTLCDYGDNKQPNSPAIEHRVPISKGGSDDMDNLRLTCGRCNIAKGTKTDTEFLAAIMPQVEKPKSEPMTELQMELHNEWWVEVNHLRRQLDALLHPRVTAVKPLTDNALDERKNRLKGANW